MKNVIDRHLLSEKASVREALQRLDQLAADAVAFVVDDEGKLISSITDGDIRRGLIKGLSLEDPLAKFARAKPKTFDHTNYSVEKMRSYRAKDYSIVPVVNPAGKIVDIVNFRQQRSYLPLDAVVMAGGKGTRLRPLTENTPKPLLKVGDKPIIEHNVDRLVNFGVRHLTISVNYLGEQLVDHFKDGSDFGLRVDYVEEDQPRGTIGAVSDIDSFDNDFILVMNSDLLTTIDFEQMFDELLSKEADMIVATVPYEVKVPYGVIETSGDLVTNLREKPTYTYYSNAGIYIIRKSHLNRIPSEGVFNATDLMENLYNDHLRVVHFPIVGYWLDIGKPADFERAQRDIKHLQL